MFSAQQLSLLCAFPCFKCVTVTQESARGLEDFTAKCTDRLFLKHKVFRDDDSCTALTFGLEEEIFHRPRRAEVSRQHSSGKANHTVPSHPHGSLPA